MTEQTNKTLQIPEPTPLDRAQARAKTGGQADDLAFFHLLADTPLLVLLQREAAGGLLDPQVFTLPEGPVVLAFDREERLVALSDAPAPYAELPGRVLARLLAEQGLGLGLNLGSDCASQMLLPHGAMVWLQDMLRPPESDLAGSAMTGDGLAGDGLARSPVTRSAVAACPEPLGPPDPQLLVAVGRILDRAPPAWGGLASRVMLLSRGAGDMAASTPAPGALRPAMGAPEVGQDLGKSAENMGLVVVECAAPAARAALAAAFGEALRFADHGGAGVELRFVQSLAQWPTAGVILPWPPLAPTRKGAAPAADLAANAAQNAPEGVPPILRRLRKT